MKLEDIALAGKPSFPIRPRQDDTQIHAPKLMNNLEATGETIHAKLERTLEADLDFQNFKPDGGVTAAATKIPYQVDPAPLTENRLRQLAKFVGDDWKKHPYYDEDEQHMDQQWRETVWPFIQSADFNYVLDLAAGHGRNSEKLKQHAKKIHIVDINSENIEFCKKRFAGDSRFLFNQNDGCSLNFIPSASISLVYCFNAMVHFDSDVVRAYLREFARVLRPNGLGFCHHSNYTQNPGGDVHRNPGWRNFMSQALFAHYCSKEGLGVVKSRVIDWERPGSDCITLFRKNPQL
jgi:ubiquinone/menaquinone biosynthesis C-methylase UbiE